MSQEEIDTFAKRADHWACFDADGPCLDYRNEALRAELRMFARLCFNDPVTDKDPRMLWEFFLETPAYRDRVSTAPEREPQ